jgi:hypothetical protein
VQVVGQHEDAGVGVAAAEPDVVQCVAPGVHAGGVDAVVADPVVGVGARLGPGSAFGRVM